MSDPLIRSFFEYVHQQGELVHVLDVITKRNSYVYNEEGCWFPDRHDSDQFWHFDGVKFGLVDGSAIAVVSEADCWRYVQDFVKSAAGIDDADAVAIARMLARVVD
jgi:hypothetical protein